MAYCNFLPNSSVDQTSSQRIHPGSEIRGKTTCKRPEVARNGITPVPAQIVEPNNFVWLVGDVIFVNEWLQEWSHKALRL